MYVSTHCLIQSRFRYRGIKRYLGWFWMIWSMYYSISLEPCCHYSGTPHNGHPSTAICDITANSPGPDWSIIVTMEPVYNSQLRITATMPFPNSGRYGGVPHCIFTQNAHSMQSLWGVDAIFAEKLSILCMFVLVLYMHANYSVHNSPYKSKSHLVTNEYHSM